tara:strand:+ start:4754 stop:5458 length:705 start_codon:yes stop_codon:yes gene_type:complete
MKRADDGYATILVTVLMGSLSLVAMAWLNLSSAEGRRASALSERIATDYAIEGAVNATLANVINHRSGTGNQTIALKTGNRNGNAVVTVTSLTDQTDINRAPIDEVEARVTESISNSALVAEILDQIRDRSGKSDLLFENLDALGSGADFNKALPCLREALTVFHDAAPPTRRSGDESLRDGSLVRIRVETGSSLASRGLDATVLLTGDRSNPAWIMDWRRYSDFDAEACDNDN